MAQLVFQSVSGGTTTLNGTNTAGTYNLTVPAADGTLLYQDTSGNITFNNLTVTGLLTITGTSAFGLPVGNTVQRPSPPAAGQIRYNTDGGGLYECYLPAVSAWYKFVVAQQGQYNITYVVVGGGGGGSANYPGGGGGGGQFTSSVASAIPSTVFTMTIGGGGAAATNGSTSTITGFAQGIGGGRALDAGVGGVSGNGFTAGGSGGASGGGGGGSAANGAGGSGNQGGAGGAGAQTLITGVATNFGGGGGGGGGQVGGGGGGGAGGAGGGGAGAFQATGGSGLVNTGGGGGGNSGNNGSIYFGGPGGSGVVILSMASANYTGTITGSPTVVNNGTTVILTYNSSGTYTA